MQRLLLLVLFALFFSCKGEEAESNFLKYRVDSLTLSVPEKSKTIQDPRNYLISLTTDSIGQKFVALYFSASQTLYKSNFKDGHLMSQTRIAGAPMEDCYSFFLNTKGDVWFSTPNELLLTRHSTDTITKAFEFLPQLDSGFYIYSYRDQAPLIMNDSLSFLQTMGSREIISPALSLAERYSAPCVGQFRIIDDTAHLVDTVVVFPEAHRKKFHYSRYPLTSIVGNVLFYVFEDGDSIYSYNLVTKRRQDVVSLSSLDKDYNPILMEEDSTYSIPYVIKNAIISPGIRLFLFDPYRKVIYLGIKKRQSYLTEDGSRINDMLDYPFRILVLDEQFKKIKSVDFPKGRFQLFDAFVGEKGLYLMTKSKKSISYEVYDFGGAGSN